MNATSVITIGPSTLEEVERFQRLVIESVQNGEENPLKLLIQMRAMEKAFKVIAESIKDNYMREADTYPEKKFQFMGNSVEKGDVHTEYDFKVCGDPTYERMEVDFLKAKADLDARKAFLKTLRGPTPVGDTVTGEIVTVRPPTKESTPGLKISIK